MRCPRRCVLPAPTSWGEVLIVTYQERTGTISPGAHAGGYNGQDAYNDMLITNGHNNNNTQFVPHDSDERKGGAGGIGLQRSADSAEIRGGSEMKELDENVRRLTPLECERLQGYPDGWTDIGGWKDTKGKERKTTDGARYKALGNSIAIPFWFYLLRRISAQYERPATLGSLFDGIGGFPYCWEKCNGKGTAIWASEIEEFPIAVTKNRFPEGDEINA